MFLLLCLSQALQLKLSARQTVVGMVEGIVPLDHSDENLRATAVFVEADEILRQEIPFT